MITPGKLFADTADEKDLMTLEELQGLEGAIGLVPNAESDDQETSDDLQPVLGSTQLFPEEPDNLVESDVSEVRKATNAARSRNARKTWLWLALTFPPVPKKGDFNVSRLKDSKYFFS